MKILGFGLVILTTVICEVPPPFSGSFRPSQPLLLPAKGHIQTFYGPPKQQYPSSPQTQYGVPNSKNFEYLEDLLGPIIPPRTVVRPQTNYKQPSRIPGSQDSLRITSHLQTTYGVPSKQQVPTVQYGAPEIRQNDNYHYYQPSRPLFGNNIDQNRKPVPSRPQNSQMIYSNNNYQSPKPFGDNFRHNQPQVQYMPSGISLNNNYQAPRGYDQQGLQGQYGVPDQRGIESFERVQQQRYRVQQQHQLINQNSLTEQYLPLREAVNFRNSANANRQSGNLGNNVPKIELSQQYRVQQQQLNPRPLTEQYLPLREAVDFRNSASANRQAGNLGNNVPTIELSQQHLPIKEANRFRSIQPEIGRDHTQNFGGVQNDIDLPTQTIAPHGDSTVSFPPIDQRFMNPMNIDIQQVEVKSVGQNDDVNSQSYQPVSDRYLPSTTTPRVTTERPVTTASRAVTTVRPTEATVEEPMLTETDDESSGNPNVAIATAVAGNPEGQTFYLVQPDGRFQRVVYQKTQEQGDQDNEYTANYNFQNIQADPDLVYTPLITLG
ncbi:unnamed protein product [Phaedon cochleariae]|uniref:Uncharacterized protein n=1 Tax=Phaedon cochleariae TaxID=80249 RepID=A0A9N9X578_PHACE|nr:unnamed protein product [Phaedon cochleariae]